MLQVQAFSWSDPDGQRACDGATKKANAWLREYPDAHVISMTASQNGYLYDELPGQEYTVTLLVDMSAYYEVPDESDEEARLAQMEQHWLEQKAIHRDDPIQY